jgi:hypothetical protein
MTSVATKLSGVSTKFQIGVAACAIATATTITPVVAHAAPAISAPLSPITSSEIMLSPVMNIAQAPCTFNPAFQCNGVFGALAEAAAKIGRALATAFVSITNVVLQFVGTVFGVGPYATSRS